MFLGCTVDVCSNEEKKFQGLLFQDYEMKRCLKNYPELFFLDATCKVLEIRLPVYLFLVEDSMGESEVVGVAVLVEETEKTVR